MIFQIASVPWGPSAVEAIDWIVMGALLVAFVLFGMMASRMAHRPGHR